VKDARTLSAAAPVWDSVSSAAAISVQLSVQHSSASVQRSARIFYTRQIYTSPAVDFGNEKEEWLSVKGDALCLKTLMTSKHEVNGCTGFEFQHRT